MLYVIIQIIAFQALFLLVYDMFLKRETFFNYNRVYLLLTSVAALIIPFLKFPSLKTITTKDMVINLPEVFIGTKTPTAYEIAVAEQVGIIMEQPQTPLWQTVAFIGIAISTLIFIFKITKLFRLKHQNPKRWQGNVLIVNLIKSSAAFSFFNTIFLGEHIPEKEKPIIYKHELVHIKELHTLDLLFFEVLRIVFWFNPLVYIYQNRIKELHEYIADAKAVKQNGKVDYYQSLLNQVFDVNNVSFTNTFFKKSLIKKRIAMLQKSKSKQLNLIKYGLLIPMILGMLIYTSTEVRAQHKTDRNDEINQELTDEELIKKYCDEIIILDSDQINNHHIIQDNYNYSSKKYVPTEDEYLRYVAYIRFMGKKFKDYSKKNENVNSLQKKRYENMILFNDSYDEHLEYLKTEAAKKSRDNSNYNRTLQVISDDIDHLTKEEHKDAYEKVVDVLKGSLYRKLQIRDNDETVEITKTNYDAIIRFFSKNEIKTLLNYIEVQELVEVPFTVVDNPPTVMECKDLDDNEERRNCMNQFINKHVNKNFNTKLADSLNPGRKRVFVQFKIDTEGKVTNVKARGPNEALEKEAKRVINTLPQFVPGENNGELVVVPYALPIVFQVASTDNDIDTTSVDKQQRLKEALYISILKVKEMKLRNQQHKDIGISEAIPFSIVEVAPIHPDCKTITDDAERRKCTSKAVSTYINSNFNLEMAKQLNLEGKQKIFVSFNVNIQGDVTDVIARASRNELEDEAVRVIKQLPQFSPGQQKGEVVNVPFSIPIIFQVSNTKKEKN